MPSKHQFLLLSKLLKTHDNTDASASYNSYLLSGLLYTIPLSKSSLQNLCTAALFSQYHLTLAVLIILNQLAHSRYIDMAGQRILDTHYLCGEHSLYF